MAIWKRAMTKERATKNELQKIEIYNFTGSIREITNMAITILER